MCNIVFFLRPDNSCESGVGSTKKEGNKWGKGKKGKLEW
jgi:hypothetical protein